MTEFPLAILTPDREWFAGPAVCVTAPGQAGEFGVMANHVPLVAGLRPGGVLVRTAAGRALWFAIDGGVLGTTVAGVHILAGRVAPCPGPEAVRPAVAAFAREA